MSKDAMYDPMDDVHVEHPTLTTAVVTFRGEHDLMARDELRALLELLVEQNTLVVADFSEALFVDSTTLHALLDTDMAARARGRTFRLQLGTAAIVRTAFELSGVLGRLDCVHSREEAFADQVLEPT
ncbi:MAG: STAS domain-containing protein [Actinomycetota bacterium]|nr:STAS domain-containing protein [Actinomycetota bacterium]